MKSLILAAAFVVAAPLFARDPQSSNLVLPLSASPQILIPAAGSTPGANGTFFHSEINVVNYARHDQRVQFRWLPRGGGASSVTEVVFGARQGVGDEDFVANILRQSGLGSIIITALNDTADTLDTSARLYATVRIWTPQPDKPAGTVSQTFLTIPLSTINSARAVMIGLRRDANFRLNVGLVNVDPVNAQTFEIKVAGSNPSIPQEVTTVVIPPMGMQQFLLAGPAQPNLQVAITNLTGTSTRSNSWVSYGSSVDEVTGDSWSMIGFEPSDSP